MRGKSTRCATTVLVFAVLATMGGCGSPGSNDSKQNGIEGAGGFDGSGGNAGGSAQGGGGTSGEGGEGGAPPNPTTTVLGSGNLIAVEACGAVPATAPDVPAGTYTIRLDASTLSKGEVDTQPKLPAIDNYVVVHLPISATADNDHRYFMLNGLGSEHTFTIDQPGTVEAFFIDSDSDANHGTATLSLNPGGLQITVDAAANVLGWRLLCKAEPARLWVEAGQREISLVGSTLSSAPGRKDDYVVIRLPSELPEDDYRYVMINGVGSSFSYNAANSDWARAWFISPSAATSGEGTLRASQP